MKKVIIFLLSITMAVCLFAGCKKKNNGDDNNKPTPEPTIETASFEKDRYVIDLYDSAELIVKSFEGKTVTYTSADESVATVDENGLAIALKAGETTVTAVSGGVKAECTVVVSETGYIPTIDLEQEVVSVDTVEPFTMAVTAEFNGKTIGEDIDCSVTLADGADETIATATVNGKEITVQGLKAGETEFYVSANVRGKYLNKKFTVKVVNLGFSIKPNDDSVDVGLNGYETSIYTRTETGANVEKKLVFDVYDGRTLVDNAQVVWSSENTDVATVEQKDGEYYIVAQKGGVANIVGEYSDGENNATVKLAVNVEKVVKSEPLDIGVTPVIGKYNENTLTIPTDKLGGEFTQISYNGKVLSTGYTAASGVVTVTLNDVNRNIIPDDSSLLGDGIVDVEDECYKYQLPVKLYTFIIKTEADLKSVKDVVSSAKGYGYYVLNNDIKLKSDWYTRGGANYAIATEASFVGIFDGCGYTIDGLSFKNNWEHSEGYAFIQNLGNGGTIKNVGFTNVSCPQKGGIVKNSAGGIVENVLVKYSARGLNQHKAATFGGVQDSTSAILYFKITLRNIVIDVSDVVSYWGSNEALSAQSKILGKYTSASTLENIVVYGVPSEFNANNVIGIQNIEDKKISTSIDGIYVYNKDTNTANKAIPATGWDSEYWTVNSNSLPVFKTAASALATTATFTEKAENIKKGETPNFTAGKNCVIELSAEAKALDVTLQGGVLTVPETVAAGTTFTVLARNLFDYDNPLELTVTYLGEVIEAELDGSDITVDLNTAADGTVAGTDVEIDLTSKYSGSCENAVVAYNGTTIDTVNITNGKLTFNTANLSSAYGKIDLVITVKAASGTTQITVKNILVVTKKIGTVAELKTVKAISDGLNGGGYFELSANITLGTNDQWYYWTSPNFVIGSDINKPFVGTFDGMGYSISGFVTWRNWTGAGFIKYMGATGVLKNVAFLNVTLQDQDAIVSYAVQGALVENVYVQITSRNGVQGKSGVFGINDSYNSGAANGQALTLKNVVVDYSGATFTGGADNSILLGRFTDGATRENVMVLGAPDEWKGKIAKIGDTLTTDGIYVTDTAGATVAGTFSAEGWNKTYWDVDDSANTVTWKTK